MEKTTRLNDFRIVSQAGTKSTENNNKFAIFCRKVGVMFL